MGIREEVVTKRRWLEFSCRQEQVSPFFSFGVLLTLFGVLLDVR